MFDEIQKLQEEIERKERNLETIELLYSIWVELGPYTDALTKELKNRLRNHFKFDDSE